ncbi:MAG: MBL fold metallo-hydrolase [Deltaproteobacteria bacterium]|nr:MBL fold metallo-hydrolase [Deltaproteobacteria bacterium]
MELIFLGTGGAWGLPEIDCDCRICLKMRQIGQKRDRTSILLRGTSTLLVDCGPDARDQLLRHGVDRVDGVLITHEHSDHYIGLDELFAYKRNCPKGEFAPFPVYLTQESYEVVKKRFSYLEEMGVIRTVIVLPGQWLKSGEFEVCPFKTYHGEFARGSVGYVIQWRSNLGEGLRMVYTSDFSDIPEIPSELLGPDYLIIQSFWLNEPMHNRPNHMSFQKALEYIDRIKPKKETFLVHMGDADMVPGDPANRMLKKYEPKAPLKRPEDGTPYPIPLDQDSWQEIVERILTDRNMPYKVTAAYDDLKITC